MTHKTQTNVRRSTLAGLVVLLLATQANAKDAARPRLTDLDGPATVRMHPAQAWKEAARGYSLRLSEHLSCPAGCSVEVGSAKLNLSPDTTVKVAPPKFYRLPGMKRSVPFNGLELLQGGLHVAVTAGNEGAVALKLSDELTLVVAQGEAEVRSSGSAVIVDPRSAELFLRRAKRWSELSGPGLVALARDGTATPRTRIAAPHWDAGSPHHRPISLAADQPRSLVSLAWVQSEAAKTYRLEVSDSAEFERILVSQEVGADRHHAEVELPEGRFFAKVRAADAVGFWSKPAALLPLRVVRVALPDGGMMPDARTLTLPDGSTLRMLDPDGLEVAMQTRSFSRARRDLNFSASRSATLRVRLTGRPDTASELRLEKRALRAAVQLTPVLPVWPDDSVAAKVRLVDPSGRTNPASIKPRIRVTVGNRAVPTSWSLDGGVWRAKIHGQTLPGPQVLRIEVDDENGVRLGENFVELVADAR